MGMPRLRQAYTPHPVVDRSPADLRAYIEACEDQGYAGPWGVEVLSEELRNRPLEDIFRRAYETTASQFGHERSSA